ncbi:S-layer homology domain-containing protein [Paenibacillus eucommiae]|uniref:SLH domain-containing protein n=1 Tax=Paenibacillus eucommiae TaxID=1355755 RepID=A0ABS4J058_9BACL|nr:S-layer homology domain-containing protein [Paenibacillus eucommiae]MBP1992626.1 hypothetical protein [Paenibacillus eucommiae]
MRESSLNNHRNSKKPKDIQGGEKKVMKKSLSVILSSAMALSMFSSMAFAKTSEDFTDLKDLDAATKAKFDALISAGIFDGVSETTFGLKDPMNRAQFAKVAALVFGLTVDSTLTTSSFTDVKADDKSNGYALPYIEALKKANLTDGYAPGEYNPAGQVTREQLATFLLRALGKDAEAKATPGVSDKTVSTWAKGYVALALELKLIDNQTDGSFGGTNVANRELLVLSGYQAKVLYEQINVPAKASVSEAKATGVQTVTVTLNKAVDTAKAKLALTRGNAAVTTTTKFADDGKSAVLTLTDSKISASEYTVTLSGLEAESIDKATGTFTGENELVSKLDFVGASDTIAYSSNATVKVKATNQYGEAASLGSSNFTAFVLGNQVAPTKDKDGNLVIKYDLKGITGLVQGSSQVPVIIYHNDTRLTANQTFKLGNSPFLSKVEVKEVEYSNKGTALASNGEFASIPLSLYDQYGNPIIKAQFDSNEVSTTTINAIVTPYSPNLAYVAGDLFDSNDEPRIRINLINKEDKTSDYTVNVYAGSSTATAIVKVSAANLATKIDFGQYSGTLAAGDTDVYLPIVATDANGKTLTAQDIVDNAGRFTFSASNTTAAPYIVVNGDNKGKLRLQVNPATTARSSVYVTGFINTATANSSAQTQIQVQEARYPERVAVTVEPAVKAILGATSKVTFQLKDQYGANIAVGSNIPNANGQQSNYKVKLTVAGEAATSSGITLKETSSGTILNNGTFEKEYSPSQLAAFNGGFEFFTDAEKTGKLTVRAVIQKDSGTGYSDSSTSISRSLEAISKSTNLTYTLGTIGNLYALTDNNSIVEATGDTKVPETSLLGKTLSITAKDAAGNTVAFPGNNVKSVTSTDSSIVRTGDAADKGYVLGGRAGTSTVTAFVYTNAGTTISLTQDVTVKADTITVDALTVANARFDYALGNNDGVLLMGLKAVDQYGIAYTGLNSAPTPESIIRKYDKLLGIRYTATSIQGDGSVNLDATTGKFSITGNVTEFVLTAVAPNGKTVSALVTKP